MMGKDLIAKLKEAFSGEISEDAAILEKYSRDASIFEVKPRAVLFPKDTEDIKNLVKLVAETRERGENISITARAGGSDMTGGPLTESLVLDMTRHFNNVREVGLVPEQARYGADEGWAVVEPGVYYRDFEKETLKKGWLLPSYPASRELCAVGGMVANNAGGELTLRYGKTENYVEELKAVFADGNEYVLKKLGPAELGEKCRQNNFEGKVYRDLRDLLEKNYDEIQKAKPRVSKNSAGYALWNVWDRTSGAFDLTKLFTGSQGTLGIITEIRFRLVRPKKHKGLAVLFLRKWDEIPGAIEKVLPLGPAGLESFDDQTLKLALKFFPEIARRVKGGSVFSLLLQFWQEFFIGIRMLGFPKLIILVQLAENSETEVMEKLTRLKESLRGMKIYKQIMYNESEAEKYWVIRRESFNLLRTHVLGKKAAPFVDDFIVEPAKLPEFLPKVLRVLEDFGIEANLAGHAGEGNFHIIPLMDLTREEEVKKISEVADKIYRLVVEYGGSITAEHNDGLIRTPYLKMMFGEKVYGLFQETKKIFDPLNIFNPRKKVDGGLEYAIKHIVSK